MKISFLFLLFSSLTTFSATALSNQLESFTCVTEHPSTSYFFNLQEEKYKLSVVHHNGVQHAPVYNGLVTINTVDYLKTSLINIQKIGERIDISFDPKDCIRLEKNRITCYKTGESKLGPLTVKDVYFNVYENSDSSTYGVFKDVRVSLDYRQNNQSFKMPMVFPLESCSNRLSQPSF